MTAETQLKLSVAIERWPIARPFAIARGAKIEAVVIVATISDENASGRGECVPYARYGETVEGVAAVISGIENQLLQMPTREHLARLLPPGAARNALDCALWDFDAKRSGRSVAALTGLGPLHPVETAYTISLGTPEEMAEAAREASPMPLLKLKLGGEGDEARMRAVRAALPHARLIADANEAWTPDRLEALMAVAAETAMELIEQPLPAGSDAALAGVKRIVPVCADESAHAAHDLAVLAGRYDAVNIKLDKTGGLTEALATQAEARRLGLKVMVGCMVATSLAMAPAVLLTQDADWVDLDGPLLLAKDREPGLAYVAGRISPPLPALWG